MQQHIFHFLNRNLRSPKQCQSNQANDNPEWTIKEKIQWVRPKLVCEVEYAELTADDQLRQTTFLGWRDDKKAKEVVLENNPSDHET